MNIKWLYKSYLTFLRNLLTKSEFRKCQPDTGPTAHEVNLVILSELIMGTGLYIGATLFILNIGKPCHWTTNYFKW